MTDKNPISPAKTGEPLTNRFNIVIGIFLTIISYTLTKNCEEIYYDNRNISDNNIVHSYSKKISIFGRKFPMLIIYTLSEKKKNVY